MTEHDHEGERAAQQAQENARKGPTDDESRSEGTDKEGEPAAQQARDNDTS